MMTLVSWNTFNLGKGSLLADFVNDLFYILFRKYPLLDRFLFSVFQNIPPFPFFNITPESFAQKFTLVPIILFS